MKRLTPAARRLIWSAPAANAGVGWWPVSPSAGARDADDPPTFRGETDSGNPRPLDRLLRDATPRRAHPRRLDGH